MDVQATLGALGVALGLGLLVGLQRELSDSKLAGFRTFALITLLGATCAIIGRHHPATMPWLLTGGLLAIGGLTAVGNWVVVAQGREREPGVTTEVAALIMFLVGVLCLEQPPTIAVALGVGMAVVLQAKKRLHDLAAQLGDKDLRAILLFAALTFIVLPILPNETFGPYGVLNPRSIWLMVVLVVGMSLGGYIAYKFAGRRAGPALAGLVGGLISSTAVTLSFSRRVGAADAAPRAPMRGVAVLAIAAASCVVYARVLVEVGVAGPKLLGAALWPIGAMFVASIVVALIVYKRQSREQHTIPEQTNPTELKSALVFALVFGLVLVAGAWAQDTLGGAGLIVIAAISGAHDMDAITLSTARLVQQQGLDPTTACRVLVVAAASNMVFKTGIAYAFGGRALAARVAFLFAPVVAVGAVTSWVSPPPIPLSPGPTQGESVSAPQVPQTEAESTPQSER